MKRRSEQNDYTERGIYLITIAIEGRKPLLGTLAGKVDVQEGPEKPHVLLSPWGELLLRRYLSLRNRPKMFLFPLLVSRVLRHRLSQNIPLSAPSGSLATTIAYCFTKTNWRICWPISMITLAACC